MDVVLGFVGFCDYFDYLVVIGDVVIICYCGVVGCFDFGDDL